MTKGEVPTMAGHEQAAGAAAEQNRAAEQQPAAVAQAEENASEQTNRQLTAEAVAAAAAAEEMAAAEQAPVQMASFEAPRAPAKAVDADEDVKKGEKKGDERDAQAEADEAPVDLAMLPEVEMLDAIAAAEGARATSGAEAEASLLSDEGGFLIPLLALAAVGLGVAVAVGGGDDDDLPPAPPPPPPANQAPVITSGATATVAENVATTTVVYDANATDANNDTITYSLSGPDAAAFTIDAATGEVRFVSSPNFEAKSSYTFTVTASDGKGGTDTQEVTVTVTDVDEAPVFSSAAEVEVEENIDVTEVILTAAATDPEGDEVTFALEGEDAEFFTIDPETGELRFVASPDFEARSEYTVTIVATDESGNETTQEVTITVTDVVEEGPTVVLLDDQDDDNNPNTPVEFDASTDDFLFVEDEDRGSFTIITGFGEGDVIQFAEGVQVSFTTGEDPNDIQITVNNNGVVSEIILDDVLPDDAGFIYDEASAEAELGFDFIQTAAVEVPAPSADQNFA